MATSRLEHRRQEIRTLYRSGHSTTTIAKLIGGCTYGAICWIVRDIARPRGEAIAMSKPPRSAKKGACHQRARGIMRRKLGRPLHRLEHVHHKDGDYTNNDLSNLEVLPAGDHLRLHNNGRRRWHG